MAHDLLSPAMRYSLLQMADSMTEEEWTAFVSDPDRAAGLEGLIAINGPDTLALLAPLVVSKTGEDGAALPKPAFVLLPPCEDKENRKKVRGAAGGGDFSQSQHTELSCT